jgi:hypothetical protein
VTRIPFRPRARLRPVVLAALVLAICGGSAQPADAIVGGQVAPPGTFGYVTFVGLSVGDGTAYYCTGALVAPSVVLTAAHCAVLLTTPQFPVSAFTVGTGRLDLADTTTGQVLGVSGVVISPTWSPTTNVGDLALLQLAQPSSALTMPIAPQSDEGIVNQPGTNIIIAGWGLTNATGPLPTQLHWVDLSIQSDKYCGQQFVAPQAYDPVSMFCASQPGTLAAACPGDSGAPAIVQWAPGQYEVIGVASMKVGTNCDPPDAFARITYASTWLTNEIGILQATAPPAETPTAGSPTQTVLLPPAAKAPKADPPSLTTRASASRPGKLAKLTFRAGTTSGRLRVHLRVLDRGVLVYSRTTRYFQPTPRAWSLAWRVPARLRHSVRFCMSAELLASDHASAPSCATLKIARR